MTNSNSHQQTNLTTSAKADGNLIHCSTCMTLNTINLEKCSICGAPLHQRRQFSLQYTMAFLVTGFLLYLPANLYPIMYTTWLNKQTENTIISGIISLWDQGSYPIAVIIFIVSVLVPIIKMLILGWLCYSVSQKKSLSYKKQHKLYRLTEFIGRWSMVDVFVVVILVTLVQMGSFMSVLPGLASIAFAGTVISTMISAILFDSRLIWDPIVSSNSLNNDRKAND